MSSHIFKSSFLVNRGLGSNFALLRLASQAQSSVAAGRICRSSSDEASTRGAAGGYHFTDYEAPDFDHYRRQATKNPYQSSLDSDAQRKMFSYSMYGMALGVSLLYTKAIARSIIAFKWPPPDVLAAGGTEVKLGDIPEGMTKMFTWRGSPVFVKHRTADEISREGGVATSELRHPEKDEERYQKPEWMIVIGVCTHLGCIPVANKGAFGGWYCPCHGSHYDASGRIRKGPAPLNLEVPPYKFVDEDTVMIGGD